MALALFDLDNTLLNGDSDHAWGLYLAQIGALDPLVQKERQDFFYQQYVDGELDIYEFCEYQFEVLRKTPRATLEKWRREYTYEIIEPMIASGKADLLEPHRQRGDTLIIITATNDFITAPIAERLGVENLIATRIEQKDGQFTGKVGGTPCFQDGKVARLNEWIEIHGGSMQDSIFYSDSYNDLPLLNAASTAVAVTPDDKLRAHANKFDWQIID